MRHANSAIKSAATKAVASIPEIEDTASWQAQYESIRSWRKNNTAPVDTIGCERLADSKTDARTQRFQTLIALMLSSQTRDEATAAAMQELRKFGLTAENIAVTDKDVVQRMISGVCFYRNKANFISQTATILHDRYNGDIPDTIEELTALPGVGKKMGYLALACGWKKISGIGVDVHVHRITNRLGWVSTKIPEKTRVSLEKFLPHELWGHVNEMLVGFGQLLCKASYPKCSLCPVSSTCAYFKQNRVEKIPTRKRKRINVD